MKNNPKQGFRPAFRYLLVLAGIVVFSVAMANAPSAAAIGPVSPDPANITRSDGTTAATGGEAEIWVFPTNDAAIDPVNLQWAADNVALSGKVLLKQYAKGTSTLTPFLFADVTAPAGIKTLFIKRSATIQGEYTSREDDGRGVKVGTTVKNGQKTFAAGGYPSAGVPLSYPSVTIKDIRFDGAGPGPIGWQSSTGYNELSGCSIVNYKRAVNVGGSPTGAWPWIMHGTNATPGVFDLSGTMVIKDNYMGAPIPYTAGAFNNLTHVSNVDFDLTITNNKFEEVWWGAILVWGNIGTTAITYNEIGKAHSYAADGAAIAVGLHPSAYFSNWAYQGDTVISHNKVTLSSYNSSGILLSLYPASQYTGTTVPAGLTYEVSDNQVTVSPDTVTGNPHSKAALACLGACSNSVWQNNTVSGTGRYGIWLTKTLPSFAVAVAAGGYPGNNTFTSNNLHGFTPVAGGNYVSLDANSQNNTGTNTIVPVGTTLSQFISDLGTGNSFSMSSPTPSSVCSSVSPSAQMIEPDADDILVPGSRYTVIFSTAGCPTQGARLSLSTDGGVTYSSVLASGIPIHGGYYNWDVPADVAADKARLKIELPGTGAQAVSELFSIRQLVVGEVAPQETPAEEAGERAPSGAPTVPPAYDPGDATAGTSDLGTDLGIRGTQPPANPGCAAGALIKGSSDTVYYCGEDGKKYLFPNRKTFLSWFSDFSSVVVLDEGQIAALADGGYLTYRPGVRMVKVASDTKVYVVDRGGLLHWVQTEAKAAGLYGANWNQFIDDIPEEVFSRDYTIGDPLN